MRDLIKLEVEIDKLFKKKHLSWIVSNDEYEFIEDFSLDLAESEKQRKIGYQTALYNVLEIINKLKK